jgi:hypothetical protein
MPVAIIRWSLHHLADIERVLVVIEVHNLFAVLFYDRPKGSAAIMPIAAGPLAIIAIESSVVLPCSLIDVGMRHSRQHGKDDPKRAKNMIWYGHRRLQKRLTTRKNPNGGTSPAGVLCFSF